MDRSFDTEKLLESWSNSSSAEDGESHSQKKTPESRQTFFLKCGVLALAAVLCATNIVWWRQFQSAKSITYYRESPKQLTYFLEPNEPEHTLVPFDHDWEDLQLIEQDGYRYADIHWANNTWVPSNGGSVAVSSEFIKTHALFPGAAPLESDPSKFHYLVATYHQLHCLSEIRDAIYFLNGTLAPWPREEPFQWDHILHCLESVRQGLACSSDPTLIPVDDSWPGLPNGQRHVCRNSEALFRWTGEHGFPYPRFVREREPGRTREWRERMGELGREVGGWEPHGKGMLKNEEG